MRLPLSVRPVFRSLMNPANPCYNASSIDDVTKWRLNEKLIDGQFEREASTALSAIVFSGDRSYWEGTRRNCSAAPEPVFSSSEMSKNVF